MRDAVSQRVSPTRWGRFKGRTDAIPLQEVDGPARGMAEMRQSVHEEALAGAGEPGEENHVGPARQLTQPAISVHVRAHAGQLCRHPDPIMFVAAVSTAFRSSFVH